MNPIGKPMRVQSLRRMERNLVEVILAGSDMESISFTTTEDNAPKIGARVNVKFELNEVQ